MKKLSIIALLATMLILIPACNNQKKSEVTKTTMQITSSVFKNNESLPIKYTCDGENVNPPLTIYGVPEEAKSIALIVDDPDAPAGTWVHWTVWNIDPKTTEIAEKSVPAGSVEGITSDGNPGYDGPCPPSGTHRYFYKIYALDDVLPLTSNANADALNAALEVHTLARAEIIGIYSRNQ